MGNFSALETLKKKNHNGNCLSCKNFYKEGNCEICLKADKFIIPEFRPYNCKDWSNKMENADKMFEELGYKKIEEKKYIAYLEDSEDLHFRKEIYFHLDIKKVQIYGAVSIQVLQAINEKYKELGWL